MKGGNSIAVFYHPGPPPLALRRRRGRRAYLRLADALAAGAWRIASAMPISTPLTSAP
jgi:hypothetical protein